LIEANERLRVIPVRGKGERRFSATEELGIQHHPVVARCLKDAGSALSREWRRGYAWCIPVTHLLLD